MNGFEMILPFLKPIEHLILDDTVSEVMVNGSDHVFIEKDGFLQQIRGLSLGEKSLMIAVKNIARRLGDDISEAKPVVQINSFNADVDEFDVSTIFAAEKEHA